VWLYLHSKSWWAPKSHIFWNWVRNGRSRSSEVIDFGTNRMRVCDFLLVVNSTLGLIFPVSEILQVFCWKQHPTPILFYPNFGGVPVGQNCRCYSKLITCVIIFELTQHIRPRYINVTDGRTDGWLTQLRQQCRALHCVHRAVKMDQYFMQLWQKNLVIYFLDILYLLMSLFFNNTTCIHGVEMRLLIPRLNDLS